jgi:hypothetical protein
MNRDRIDLALEFIFRNAEGVRLQDVTEVFDGEGYSTEELTLIRRDVHRIVFEVIYNYSLAEAIADATESNVTL